jgi:GNAT superfamily N-acetyltransferase
MTEQRGVDPEREPVSVRRAVDADAAAIAPLLAHLGYPAPVPDVPIRLARLRAVGDDAFVAEVSGSVVGLATVHSRAVLHNALPVAQLTALVVPPEMRGCGVGRALVDMAEQWARERGADRLVVTTALHRAEAPTFYERLGFEHTGRRYVKRFG